MFKTNTGIGLIDLETSYLLLTDFGLRNNGYHSPESIVQDWNIYCGAFKFLDNSKMYAFCVSPDDLTNDYEVVKQLRELLVETKLLIGHNLDKFDLKKFNTRLIYHSLPPIDHKILTLDTLKVAKKHFAFTSNKLDYLAKFLGVDAQGKLPHKDTNPWAKLIRGIDVKETLEYMLAYNKHDVFPLLEGVYLRLRPYIDHPLLGEKIKSHGDVYCQHCGSNEMQSRGTRLTKAGISRYRYQCQNRGCMGWTSIKDEPDTVEIKVA